MSVWLPAMLMAAALVDAHAPNAQDPARSDGADPARTSEANTRPVVRGDRLRWRDASGRRVIGHLVEGDANHLVVHISGRPHLVRVPTSAVQDLEVSIGLRRNAGKGAKIGFLSLGTVGAVLGLLSFDPDPGGYSVGGVSGVIGMALFSGAHGAVIGGLLGLGIRTEHWQRTKRQSPSDHCDAHPHRGGRSCEARLAVTVD